MGRLALPHPARPPDEVGNIVMKLDQRRRVDVHHVAGLVVMILDIALERGRDWHVVHLGPAFEIGRRDVEIAAVDHHLQRRVLFHR